MNSQQNFPHMGPPNAYQFATGGHGASMMAPPVGMMGPRPTMGPGPMNMGPRPTMMHPSQFQTNINIPSHSMMATPAAEPERPSTPEKPKKLKIELTNKERGYYSNLLSKLETDGSSRIEGKTAVNFFKTSGVNVDTLKSIWRI